MVELSRRALVHVRHRFGHRPLMVEAALLGIGWLLLVVMCIPILFAERSTGLFLYGASLTVPLTILLMKSATWLKRAKQQRSAF